MYKKNIVLLFFVIFNLFPSCKENKLPKKVSNVNQERGFVKIPSSHLNKIFETGKDSLIGIIINLDSLKKNRVEFLRVGRLEHRDPLNWRLIVSEIEEEVKVDGSARNHTTKKENDFEFIELIKNNIDTSFRFAFFTKFQLAPVLRNKNLAVYGSKIDFGNQKESIVKGTHFTFRIEGKGEKRKKGDFPTDFPFFGAPEKVSLPYFQIGLPCPPNWMPGITTKDKNFMDSLTKAFYDFKEND